MANLPRLTGALRAFANVSSQDSHGVNTNKDLLVRRLLQAELQSKDNNAWQSLVSLVKNSADAEVKDVSDALKQLTASAKAVGKSCCLPCYMYP